jgi:putative ABC transport system permease protein
MNGTLVRIAWRNVKRHGKRTALTIITMTFGIGLFIGIDSLMLGMDRMGLENIINITDSHLRISTAEYENERRSVPLAHGLKQPDRLAAYLLADPRVEAVTFRTRFVGSLSNGTDAVPVMAVALDPQTDPGVFPLGGWIEGSWFDAEPGGEPGYQVILGSRLAEELGVVPGPDSYVTLSARTLYETPNGGEFRVAGILKSPEPQTNKSAVYITMTTAEDFLELEGLRTEAAVRMKPRVNLKDAMEGSDSLAASVREEFPGLEARSFGEVGREFLELSKAKSKSTGMIILVILAIAGVGIANTVLMSIYSRIREIGVLRAFGLKPRHITRLFLFEGGIIGLLGSVAGVVFGIGLVILLIKVGYPVEKMMGNSDMGLPVWGTIYGEWNPAAMTGGALFGLVVALAASYIPARKAAKLEVTNALRFV